MLNGFMDKKNEILYLQYGNLIIPENLLIMKNLLNRKRFGIVALNDLL